jgi:hypothetical protein
MLSTAAGVALLVVSYVSLASPVAAQQSQEPSWTEVKCERYKKAWATVMERRGTRGLGQAFLERHDAFLASGCLTQADVCPRSKEELDVANIMVIAAMNAGTASTFPPFACRK